MWSNRKLGIVLYPFVTATVAINLFFAMLIGTFMDWPALSPVNSILLSIPLGIPATWLAVKWVRSLLNEAER